MKLSVFEFWTNDGAIYYIEDQETNTPYVVDITFDSKEKAQEYLDTHREEIERKGLPPLSPEDLTSYWRIVESVERKLDAGDLRIEDYWGADKFLLRLARQPVPLGELALQRLERVIDRLNLLAENAVAAEAKAPLDAREAEMNLDLARAYLEMQDREGALFLLDKVVRRAEAPYVLRARRMIDEISGQDA